MANSTFEEAHLQQYREEGYDYLATIPEVKQFLDTEIFETISLVRDEFVAELFRLEFDVVAPDLMEHPKARLIEHGLAKQQNFIICKQSPDKGVQRQKIGFFENTLQITLNIRSEVAKSIDQE